MLESYTRCFKTDSLDPKNLCSTPFFLYLISPRFVNSPFIFNSIFFKDPLPKSKVSGTLNSLRFRKDGREGEFIIEGLYYLVLGLITGRDSKSFFLFSEISIKES